MIQQYLSVRGEHYIIMQLTTNKLETREVFLLNLGPQSLVNSLSLMEEAVSK